jgi:hypothetical protein
MVKLTPGHAVLAVVTFAAGWLCAGRFASQPVPRVMDKPERPARTRVEPASAPAEMAAALPTNWVLVPVQPSPIAFAAVLKLKARREREAALETIGRSVASTNLAEAIRMAAEISDYLDREAFLSGVVEVWAAREPDAALAYCLNQPYSVRCRLVASVFAERARSNPEAAFQALSSVPLGELHDKAAEALFTTWSATAPADAALKARSIKDAALRERVLDSFAGEWAANDPTAAFTWAAELDRPEDQSTAMNSAVREFSRRHPTEALQWADQQMRGNSPLPPDAVAALLAEVGFAAPKEAFRWGVTLPDEPRILEAFAAVTSYYAEDHSRGLLNDFRQLNLTEQEQTAGPVMFALGAALSTVPYDLLSSFPHPEAQSQAVNAHVEGLMFRDAEAAHAWVETLPEGPVRAAALDTLEQSRNQTTAGVTRSRPPSPAR